MHITDGYFSGTDNTAHEHYDALALGPGLPPPQRPLMRWEGRAGHLPLPFTPGIGSRDNGMATGPAEGFDSSGRSGIGEAYGFRANYEEGTWGSLYLPTPSHMGHAPATFSQLRGTMRARAEKYNHDTSRFALPAVFAPVNTSNFYGGLGSST
jgi:hypothetical protein